VGAGPAGLEAALELAKGGILPKVYEKGEEIVDDPVVDPDPATPLAVTTKVHPHSLPRLRYGRSYAFRAWAVDLAGNSRSHTIGPAPNPSSSTISSLTSILAARAPAVEPADYLSKALSAGVALAAARRMAAGASGAAGAGRAPEGFSLFSDSAIDAAVLTRLRTRRAATGFAASRAATRPRSSE